MSKRIALDWSEAEIPGIQPSRLIIVKPATYHLRLGNRGDGRRSWIDFVIRSFGEKDFPYEFQPKLDRSLSKMAVTELAKITKVVVKPYSDTEQVVYEFLFGTHLYRSTPQPLLPIFAILPADQALPLSAATATS
jgi:hypothetical protein